MHLKAPNKNQSYRDIIPIARSEKEAKKIFNYNESWGRYDRDNTGVIKNGAHNIVRVYWHDCDESLACELMPTLSKNGSQRAHHGIYAAAPRIMKKDSWSILETCADLGLIPQSVKYIHVIKKKNVEAAKAYISRGKHQQNVMWLGDESRTIEDTPIPPGLFKKVNIPEGIVYDDSDKTNIPTMRLKDENVAADSVDLDLIKSVYCNAARISIEDKREKLIDELPWTRFVEFLSQDPQYVEAVFCGHLEKSLNLSVEGVDMCGLSWKDTSRFSGNDIDASIANTNLNAQYNFPYSEGDPRGFTFAETDKLVRAFRVEEKNLTELKDILKIWRKYTFAHPDEAVFDKFEKIMDSNCKTNARRLAKLGEQVGINAMVDAYYCGVPIDDILA